MKKTSQQWSQEPQFREYTILDPDGWDRQNFNYSFKHELITEQEFIKRLMNSTIELP